MERSGKMRTKYHIYVDGVCVVSTLDKKKYETQYVILLKIYGEARMEVKIQAVKDHVNCFVEE
jgi:hypothetical protein